MDRIGFLERLLHVLEEEGICYAVIGGHGVNAYAEPLVSLQLDLAVASGERARAEALLRKHFQVERFPHSLNISLQGSGLRVQIQLDPRYAEFVERSAPREVLGVLLPVADIRDVLQGKIWAAQDPGRRPTKRLKDIVDIARLIDAEPGLREMVPAEILARMV